MNSPAEKQKQMKELTDTLLWQQDALTKLAAQTNQLQRILWMTVWTYGGRVEIHESAIPSLWKLEKSRGEANSLILTAAIMENPPEERVVLLVEKLTGTTKEIQEFQNELGLEQYPPAFLDAYISDRITRTRDGWIPTPLAKAALSQNQQN